METLICEVCGPWERVKQVGRKPKTCPTHRAEPVPRREAQHGTDTRYRKHGCRCDLCKAGHAATMRRYNERLRERGLKDVWQRRRERQGRFSIAHADRLAIYARDEHVCRLCFRPVDYTVDWKHDLAPTLDHKIARSLGGSDDPENLRTAHRICNSLRGAERRSDEEVYEHIHAS